MNPMTNWLSLTALALLGAAPLQQQGLREGDKVLLLLEYSDELLPAFWGCILGGMIPVVVPIPPRFDADNRHPGLQ